MVLVEDQPMFKAINPTTWIKKMDYLEQAFLLGVLKPLLAKAWTRVTTVTGAGKS